VYESTYWFAWLSVYESMLMKGSSLVLVLLRFPKFSVVDMALHTKMYLHQLIHISFLSVVKVYFDPNNRHSASIPLGDKEQIAVQGLHQEWDQYPNPDRYTNRIVAY